MGVSFVLVEYFTKIPRLPAPSQWRRIEQVTVHADGGKRKEEKDNWSVRVCLRNVLSDEERT